MADYSKLTKRELIMTLYARDLMLENERKRLEYLTEKYFELKQQLHDLPKKIVGEIEKYFTEYLPLKYKTGAGFYARLNVILENFGGEDE